MATEVDICNLALARLGDEAGISAINPPDNSAQANYCHTLYPIAVQAMLDRHAWSFNTHRFTLTSITNPTTSWLYCYNLPSDFVNIITLIGSGVVPIKDFSIEVTNANIQVLYCNDLEVELVYSSSVVSASNFPSLFVDALALLLAHYLAGPLVKGDVGVAASKAMLQLFQVALSQAIITDCRNFKNSNRFTPTAITARG